jgi:hypothetical protein
MRPYYTAWRLRRALITSPIAAASPKVLTVREDPPTAHPPPSVVAAPPVVDASEPDGGPPEEGPGLPELEAPASPARVAQSKETATSWAAISAGVRSKVVMLTGLQSSTRVAPLSADSPPSAPASEASAGARAQTWVPSLVKDTLLPNGFSDSMVAPTASFSPL